MRPPAPYTAGAADRVNIFLVDDQPAGLPELDGCSAILESIEDLLASRCRGHSRRPLRVDARPEKWEHAFTVALTGRHCRQP